MEFVTELDKENGIFMLRVLGQYRRPLDGFEAQYFVVDSFKEHGCRKILLDLTKAEIISEPLSALELANSKRDVVNELRQFKFAAVYQEITADDRFFETAATNRGLTVKAFDNIKEAMNWLIN